MGEHFEALVGWLGTYGYPVLFLTVFAENVGVPVPGETTVLAASLLASRPNPPLTLIGVIAVTFVAAVLGDNLGFWLGRHWARGRLEQGKRFLFLTPKTLQSVEGYFEHYGTLTVFFARFVTGLRVVAALAAGTSKMAWPRFLLANAGGAAAWSVTMSLIGYFFGQSWHVLHKWMGRGSLIIVACVVVLIGLPLLLRHARKLPAGTWQRLLRAEVWQGLSAALLAVLCLAVLVILAEHGEPSAADRQVRRWIESRPLSLLGGVALGGSYLGSLPVVTAATLLVLGWGWKTGRPRRETAALLWALVASEALGLLLLGLLRHKGLEPARALAWPFGFAGLAPLRAAAVFGMLAHLLPRCCPGWAVAGKTLAACLVLLVGFSVVWTEEQYLTEVFVEYLSGGLLLFAGLWWLEGFGGAPANPESAEVAQVSP